MTYLEKAQSNYNTAVELFNTKNDDENRLNIIAYLLQQSAELSLKYFIETKGIEYGKTHDVGLLLKKATELGFESTRELRLFANTLTMWESRTRYIKNFTAEKEDIQEAFSVVKEIIFKSSLQETREF